MRSIIFHQVFKVADSYSSIFKIIDLKHLTSFGSLDTLIKYCLVHIRQAKSWLFKATVSHALRVRLGVKYHLNGINHRIECLPVENLKGQLWFAHGVLRLPLVQHLRVVGGQGGHGVHEFTILEFPILRLVVPLKKQLNVCKRRVFLRGNIFEFVENLVGCAETFPVRVKNSECLQKIEISSASQVHPRRLEPPRTGDHVHELVNEECDVRLLKKGVWGKRILDSPFPRIRSISQCGMLVLSSILGPLASSPIITKLVFFIRKLLHVSHGQRVLLYWRTATSGIAWPISESLSRFSNVLFHVTLVILGYKSLSISLNTHWDLISCAWPLKLFHLVVRIASKSVEIFNWVAWPGPL